MSTLHPSKPVVAYTAGCMIIVYDLLSDAKIELSNHQHEVKQLVFSAAGAGGSTTSGDYLISIDFNRTTNESTMCLWNWSKGQCL